MNSIRFSLNSLYLLIIFLYLFFLSFLNFTIFYQVFAILVIIVSVFKTIHSFSIQSSKYFTFQLLFVVSILLSIPLGLTINKESTLSASKTIIFNLMINFALFNLIGNKSNLIKVMKMFIPIAIFSGLYIIIYSKGVGINGRLGHGVLRPFADSTKTYTSMEFASWSLYASIFSIFFYFTEKKKVYLLPIPFYWLIIMWAGSRKWLVFGGLLELLVIVFCGSNDNILNRIKMGFTILIIVGLLCLLVFSVPIFYQSVGIRIVEFFTGTESSSLSRDDMFFTALDYFQKKPIFGYGFNTFRNISKYETWSESNFTEILFGGGIFLFILYYSYEIGLLICLYKKRNDKLVLLFCSIVLMLLLSDFVSMSYQDRLATFFITSASLIYQQNNQILIYNKERKIYDLYNYA